jgi:hypothetical protein
VRQVISNDETAMATAHDLSAAIAFHYVADAILGDLGKEVFRAQEKVKQLLRSTQRFATWRLGQGSSIPL